MAASTDGKFEDEDVAPVSDINVTPLVDVVLVLLIVFMITMPAIVGAAQIKIDLLQAFEPGIKGDFELPLNFTLKREPAGNVLYLESIVADDAVLERVVKEYQPLDNQTITLTADHVIPYGDVVKVMDRLAGFGLQKVSLNIKTAR